MTKTRLKSRLKDQLKSFYPIPIRTVDLSLCSRYKQNTNTTKWKYYCIFDVRLQKVKFIVWLHFSEFFWIFSTKRQNKKEGKKYFYFREFFLFVCWLSRSPIFNSTIVRTAKTQPYFIQTAAERKQPQFRNPFRNEIVSTFALSSWKMHICFFEKHLVWAEQNDKIISCAIFISLNFFLC
jgi:hypothetical protein